MSLYSYCFINLYIAVNVVRIKLHFSELRVLKEIPTSRIWFFDCLSIEPHFKYAVRKTKGKTNFSFKEQMKNSLQCTFESSKVSVGTSGLCEIAATALMTPLGTLTLNKMHKSTLRRPRTPQAANIKALFPISSEQRPYMLKSVFHNKLRVINISKDSGHQKAIRKHKASYRSAHMLGDVCLHT